MPRGGKPPTPPDPNVVASAQSAANRNSFDYSTGVNRVNYVTPTGSAIWSQTGGGFDDAGYQAAMKSFGDAGRAYLEANPDVAADPFYKDNPLQHYKDHGTKEGRTWTGSAETPDEQSFYKPATWTGTSSLSEGEQEVYDADLATRRGIASGLSGMTSAALDQMGRPMDFSGAPDLQTYTAERYDPAAFLYNPTLNTDRVDYSKISKMGRMTGDYSVSKMGSQWDPSGFASFDPGEGRSSTFKEPTLTDKSGRFNERSGVRDWASILGGRTAELNDELAGLDPWAFDDQGADAMWNTSTRYLLPQWESDRKMMEARLGEQGFVPGTPAYNDALETMMNSQSLERDQARDKALLAGREFGNQAFDNKSGALRDALANIIDFGKLGVDTDTARDTGNANFNEVLSKYLTNFDTNTIAAGRLGLDAARTADDYNLDRAKFREDALGNRFDMARDYTTTNNDVVEQQFGLDKDKLGFNNDALDTDLGWQKDALEFNAQTIKDNNAAANAAAGTNSLITDRATNTNNTGLDNQVNTNNDARSQYFDEQDIIQNADINRLFSVLKNLGVETPPEMQTDASGGTMTEAQIAEYINKAFGGEVANYNAGVSSGNATKGAFGSIGAAIAAALISDRRLKRDIRRIGESPRGYPWYEFRYVWDKPGTLRQGVMAQDVIAMGGLEAIHRWFGFYAVDYSKV